MPRYLFDQFCLDTDARVLSRGGLAVRLSPRAFSLLEILVRQHPKAVSKRDLLDQVWEGSAVAEANLKTLVLEIRDALAERGGSRDAIRTVFGFGYAFARSVTESSPGLPPEDALVAVRWSDQTRCLPAGTFLIGRRADCAISIDAPSVSRVHAKLEVAREAISIEDLGSKNGTFVGGWRVDRATELLPRAQVRVGDVALQIARLDTSTESTVTVGVSPDAAAKAAAG